LQTKKYPSPSTGDVVSNFGGLIFAGIILFVLLSQLDEISRYDQRKGSKKQDITTVSIEIAPAIPFKEKLLYIESNPDVHSNAPDQAKFFSSREQQSANLQNKKAVPNSDAPFINGNSQNFKIIKNQANHFAEKSAPPKKSKALTPINVSESESKGNNSPYLPLPISKPEIKQIKEQESYYSKKEKAENPQKIIKLGENTPNKSKGTASVNTRSKQNDRQIAQRPRISPQLLNGPILKSKSSAARIGEIAVDCKLHPYGVYLQQMLQAIESQWYQLVKGSLPYIQKDKIPPEIVYSFLLNSKGKLETLTSLGSQEDTLASDLCRQAISSRAPFGKWSEEMIKDLGETDLITIKFSYH